MTTGRDDFPLPKTAKSLAAVYEELRGGKGFVQMRGLPVAEISRARAASMIWGIGSNFGNVRPLSPPENPGGNQPSQMRP